MGARRPVAPRTRPGVIDHTVTDRDGISRLVGQLVEASQRRDADRSRIVVDLVTGTNRVVHGLSSRPFGCVLTPSSADASFAWSFATDGDSIAEIGVVGVDQPACHLEFFRGVTGLGASSKSADAPPVPPPTVLSYLELTAVAADPTPAGVDDYLWLKTDGSLYSVISGVNVLIGPTPATISDLFDTILSPAQITSTVDNWNPGTLGTITLIKYTADAGRIVRGMTGGVDGKIVCALNMVTSGGSAANFQHEDVIATAANRFRNVGAATATGGALGAVWYRYDGASARWQNIMGTQ